MVNKNTSHAMWLVEDNKDLNTVIFPFKQFPMPPNSPDRSRVH